MNKVSNLSSPFETKPGRTPFQGIQNRPNLEERNKKQNVIFSSIGNLPSFLPSRSAAAAADKDVD